MPILSAMRRSRTAAGLIVLSTVGLLGTAGAFGACGDRAEPSGGDANANANAAPSAPRTPTYSYEIVNVFPHDPDAFTQGLQWHNGRLFESTGQVGSSDLREVELTSGRVIRRQPLEEPHFGEGMVILGTQLYQITWTSGKAFTYDPETFRRTGSFNYDGEGWGLTTDGTALVMSNGTPVILWRDPKTFAALRNITVTDHGTPVTQLNELEWVKGELWANVWQSERIARIDPATGTVLGWIDLGGILPAIDRTGKEDVLNGIAYDAEKDRLFVTGKLWSKLYEIRITPRG